MTIRRRLSLSAAVAVAVAVALASGASYLAVRAKLRGELDSTLRQRAAGVRAAATRRPPAAILRRRRDRPRFAGPTVYLQLVRPDGSTRREPVAGTPPLPVDARVRSIAAGHGGQQLRDAKVNGLHLRLLAAPLSGRGAIEVARPLTEVDSVLSSLVALLAAITLVGVVVAAALGGLISRAALAPVRRFTERSERLTGALDLGQRLPVERDDELGRLARAFNTTLDALERALTAQRQLVADASHELRTPLASLRTNIEVLERDAGLPQRDRAELMHDVVEQIDELSALVGDIVEVARRGEQRESFEELRLDELVTAAIERTRRHSPATTFEDDLEPTLVRGVPERIDRLVANLLDNAVKWSPGGGTVEVSLHDGRLGVRDHGPGFASDDLPLVFDRFYRSRAARGTPGSGLGLAIVRQVAEAHGGSATAANAPGGGALLEVCFPDTSRLERAGGGETWEKAHAVERPPPARSGAAG